MKTAVFILVLMLLAFVFGLLLGKGHGPALLQWAHAAIGLLKRGSQYIWQFARTRLRKERVP